MRVYYNTTSTCDKIFTFSEWSSLSVLTNSVLKTEAVSQNTSNTERAILWLVAYHIAAGGKKLPTVPTTEAPSLLTQLLGKQGCDSQNVISVLSTWRPYHSWQAVSSALLPPHAEEGIYLNQSRPPCCSSWETAAQSCPAQECALLLFPNLTQIDEIYS